MIKSLQSQNQTPADVIQNSRTYPFNSILSDDGNQLMYNQLMHNILETINSVCTQYQISEEEAFEKIFFEWSNDNLIREQLIEGNSEVSIQEFTKNYAQKLLQFNSHYLEMRDLKEKLLATIGSLEAQRYSSGKRYHYIDASAMENKLMTSIIQASSLEGEPQIIVYVYIDKEFAYKSRVYPKSSTPVINLDIDISLPEDSKKLVLEFYDAQDGYKGTTNHDDELNTTEKSDWDDEDKVFYTPIGKTELVIDKILQNLLVTEEYTTTRNIILQEVDEDDADTDIFSNHSFKNRIYPENKNLIQTKGRVFLMFTAELTAEFLERIEVLKKQYITETVQNIEQLAHNIEQKSQILHSSIESLQYIQFDLERGLVLDELPMLLYNSKLEETYFGNRSQAGDPKYVKSVENSEEIRKMKQRTQKVIEQYEKPSNGKGRMCGCEACVIF